MHKFFHYKITVTHDEMESFLNYFFPKEIEGNVLLTACYYIIEIDPIIHYAIISCALGGFLIYQNVIKRDFTPVSMIVGVLLISFSGAKYLAHWKPADVVRSYEDLVIQEYKRLTKIEFGSLDNFENNKLPTIVEMAYFVRKKTGVR